jgi:integrase
LRGVVVLADSECAWEWRGLRSALPVREVARIESTARHKPRSLTAKERRQWLSAVQTSDKALAWDLPDLSLMMLATGCRIGECLAIGWEEVDLDRAMVDVCWRLVRRTGVELLRLPSTKSASVASGSSHCRAGP